VSIERFGQIVRQLAASGVGSRPLGEVIGDASDSVLGTPHAGLLVLDADAAPTAFASSTALMATLEDLELTMGAGPCTTAFRSGAPTSEPDLERSDPGRWLGFTPAALEAGARSAFAFPLVASGRAIGSLNLTWERAGGLTSVQRDDATTLTNVLTQLLITQDALGWAATIDDLMHHQAVVHQATGMVGVQLEVSMVLALAVLRARAFGDGRPVGDVAEDVVARRLRLD
jgi:hypothetical protein